MSETMILFFSFMFCLTGTIAGFIFGWFSNEYYTAYHQAAMTENVHPEMLNEDGEYVREELLAVRFVDEDEELEDE